MEQRRSTNPSYGKRIRYEREQLGLSQQALAERVDATLVTVSNWEREKTMPGPYHRQRLSEVFGKNLVELGLLQALRAETSQSTENPAALAAPATPAIVSVPASPTPVWNIPYARNIFFTGREEVIQALHATLLATGTAALTQPQVLSGLGGIGKTQTAIEYAYRYRDHYQAMLWARAESAEVLISDLVSIAALLHLPAQQDENQSRVVQAVKRWLEQHEHWLLILDNADDLEMVGPFLPSAGRGHVLLTTRTQATGTLADNLSLEKMTPEVSALLLLRRAKLLPRDVPLEHASPSLQSQARRIVDLIDGLPLALDQAGAYLEETSCGLDAYLTLYQARRSTLLQRRGRLTTNHSQSVTMTWALCFEQVEQRSPAAAELLRLCAFLHPDTIQEEMLVEGASLLGPVLAPVAADPLELNEAINELRRFSLVRRNPDAHTLTIHRLVQIVLKDRMDDATQRQWAARAVNIVNRMFPDVVIRFSIASWPQCQQYLPHVEVCAELVEQWQIQSAEAARLFDQAGIYLQERAQYQEAQGFLQRAFAIRQQTLGLLHADVARSLHNLADLNAKQGRYTEAESLYRQTLQFWEHVPQPDPLAMAHSLRGLARVYLYQSRFIEAAPLFLRALQFWEQAVGPDHPEVAYTLRGLAAVYGEQGKFAEVESILQRVLQIQKQTLGPDHIDMASSFEILGTLYYEQDQYAEAESSWQEALRIEKQALGTDHPKTAYMLSSLAELYIKQGKYAEAEPLSLDALRLWEEAMGPLYPDITYALINLAEIYRQQRRFQESESILQRAQQLQEQTLEPDHLYTAWTARGLAELYWEQGKYSEAELLYQKALTIYEQRIGSEHFKTRTLKEQYAARQKEKGKT